MNYKFGTLVLICLQFLLGSTNWAACEGKPNSVEPIRMGGAFALSGVAAPFGSAELNAVTLALEEINQAGGVGGRPLQLITEDTQSSNVHTVNAVTKLLAIDGVKIIVGPTWADSFAGALPIAQKRGALLVTPSAVPMVMKKSAADFPLVFSTYFDQNKEVIFLLQRAKVDGARSVALVFDQDPFFEAVHQSSRSEAAVLGIQVKHDLSVQTGSVDFRSELAKIKKSGVDAIIFGFADQASLLAFLKQRASLLPGTHLYGFHDLEGYVDQEEFRGMFPNTDYSVPTAPNSEFSVRYERKFGSPPLLTASNAYDAVLILAQAMRAGNFEPQAIANYWRSNTLQTESFGPTKFDQLGGISSGHFEIRKAG